MKNLAATLVLLLFAGGALAQPKPLYEVGASYYFADEGAVDVSDVRGWASVIGIELPLPGETVSGLMLEAGYTTSTVWSAWSANETEINNVIAGGHMRIAKGGPVGESSFDFDFRIVAGYRLTENLGFRVYFLEDQTPVTVSLGWRF